MKSLGKSLCGLTGIEFPLKLIHERDSKACLPPLQLLMPKGVKQRRIPSVRKSWNFATIIDREIIALIFERRTAMLETKFTSHKLAYLSISSAKEADMSHDFRPP